MSTPTVADEMGDEVMHQAGTEPVVSTINLGGWRPSEAADRRASDEEAPTGTSGPAVRTASVDQTAVDALRQSGINAAMQMQLAGGNPNAAQGSSGAVFEGHSVAKLEAAALVDPAEWGVKVAFMTEEMQAFYKEADFMGRTPTPDRRMAWQLASPNGVMTGFGTAIAEMSNAATVMGDEGTPEERRMLAWHGNMLERDHFDDHDDAGAAAGMLTPWRLQYFLCAMGSGKTLPEILMALLVDWSKMAQLRTKTGMDAEPCTLLTAPGREQVDQMRQQGLGVTDVEKLKDMPMCYLSGIPAEILARFNERVVFLGDHTASEWFHPVNMAKLRKGRVFVSGIAKIAGVLKYEREELKAPELERFFHERKFSLWLADEAHFGIHYPVSPFDEPSVGGEWSWVLYSFKYAYVAKFSGSIHEVEDTNDRVPKGGRCTSGELIHFRRMAEPRITVCSYEGMRKYDDSYFHSDSLTDKDVNYLRTHPRYLTVFFWEVMRDVLRRRKETRLPKTAMIRIPEIFGGVKGCVDLFNKFLEDLGDAAVCSLTGRRLVAVGTWSQGLSAIDQARAMNGIRWAVEADVLFVYNQCVLGYDNQSLFVTGNARHTSEDWDAGQQANQFELRDGRWATDTPPNHLGLEVSALHHSGCSTCKDNHLKDCSRRSKIGGKHDFRFDFKPVLCGACAKTVTARADKYKAALTAYNDPSVKQDCGVFLQQIDCEKDGHNLQHLTRYLKSQNATNVVSNITTNYLRERQAEVIETLNQALEKVKGVLDPSFVEEEEAEEEEEEEEEEKEEEEEEEADKETKPVALTDAEEGEDGEEDSNAAESEGEDGGELGGSAIGKPDGDTTTEDESSGDDDYSDSEDDDAGSAPVKEKETRSKRKKAHATPTGSDDDGLPLSSEPAVDPLVGEREREAKEAAKKAGDEAKAEQERIEEQQRKAERVAQAEAEAIDKQAEADLERQQAELQKKIDAAQKHKEERQKAAREKAEAAKAEAALRAEADKKRAEELARAEQQAAFQLANFGDLAATVKCVRDDDDIKMRFEMAKAPRANCTVGLAISTTGAMAKPGKTDLTSKTSYHLHQLNDSVVTQLESNKVPYRLLFDRPKNRTGRLHFRVFALKPGAVLNDPNPKKGMTLGDLMYATAPIVVDVHDLEAAMPPVNEPETPEERSGTPMELGGAANGGGGGGSGGGGGGGGGGSDTEQSIVPVPIDWGSMAAAMIWCPKTGKRKTGDRESLTVKKAHRARGSLTALLHNMTPGTSGESYNALLACFLLDLFGIAEGQQDKMPPDFPRHFSYGWFKSEWGDEYTALLAMFLKWLDGLPQSDEHELRASVTEHQALYTVDKVLPASRRADIEALKAVQSQGGRRQAAGIPFLDPDTILAKYADGWARLEQLARSIRDSQRPQKSDVATPHTQAWVTSDRHDVTEQDGKLTRTHAVKRKKMPTAASAAVLPQSQSESERASAATATATGNSVGVTQMLAARQTVDYKSQAGAWYPDVFDNANIKKFQDILQKGTAEAPVDASTAKEITMDVFGGVYHVRLAVAADNSPFAGKINVKDPNELMHDAIRCGMDRGGALDLWFHEQPSPAKPYVDDTDTAVQDWRSGFNRWLEILGAEPKPPPKAPLESEPVVMGNGKRTRAGPEQQLEDLRAHFKERRVRKSAELEAKAAELAANAASSSAPLPRRANTGVVEMDDDDEPTP